MQLAQDAAQQRNPTATLSKSIAGPGRPILPESVPMATSTLRLVHSGGGWQLLDDGRPVFWFPDRSKGLEIAQLMADARNLNRGQPTTVEAMNDDGELETVAAFA